MAADPEAPLASHVERNAAAIARMEQAALDRQSRVDRLVGAVARFCGSLSFVVAHLGVIGVWVAINRPSSTTRFDPYPYYLLLAIVTIEALLLSAFVLMRQNQMSKNAERRANLTLQIDMLAEVEMTKALAMLQALMSHLNVPGTEGDEEVRELAQPTVVEDVARALEATLPEESTPSRESPDRHPLNDRTPNADGDSGGAARRRRRRAPRATSPQ